MPGRKAHLGPVVALVVAGALLLAAVGIAQTGAGRSVLSSAGVAGQPARYTELYFAAPERLPLQVPRGRSSMPVPFMIHNLEGHPTSYRWVIRSAIGDSERLLASGHIELTTNATAYLHPAARVVCHARRARVTVRLEGTPDSIDFLAACVGNVPPTPTGPTSARAPARPAPRTSGTAISVALASRSAIPRHVPVGRVTLSVPFVIRNAGTRNRSLAWNIETVDAGRWSTLMRGRVHRLSAGGDVRLAPVVEARCVPPGFRLRVLVDGTPAVDGATVRCRSKGRHG